jgi:hypothetical protein
VVRQDGRIKDHRADRRNTVHESVTEHLDWMLPAKRLVPVWRHLLELEPPPASLRGTACPSNRHVKLAIRSVAIGQSQHPYRPDVTAN